VLGCELDKLITLGQKERFTAYHKCAYPLTDNDRCFFESISMSYTWRGEALNITVCCSVFVLT
jgi:hypothetical protein